MKSVSYLMVRLGIGISMLGHGLVRIPKLKTFSEGMINNFQDSLLPEFLLIPFSFALPFIEFLLGVLLIIGWQTKRAAIGGGCIMLALIAGTSLIENWSALPSQMIHLLFFVLVYEFNEANTFALDRTKE
ncbi:DoxX family membrane protein [Cyclobacterium sp. 1_MG-2023]|uniref:DoxX family membrane protein n=1 Tax=Cyclobacterium sp. 1_MG-2023 TaxID=3062681 RepID=UPI0026E1ED54|nr:DoxX family membrane protein [Cyclobacterium sp. 1_MG-2023]MDO6437378.1 DoxX family membrane protein [Cyclobacterium sp. 1_MG-2023]